MLAAALMRENPIVLMNLSRFEVIFDRPMVWSM
jgi:hypothetical protein